MRKAQLENAGYRRFAWVAATVLLLLVVPKLSMAQYSGGTILGTVEDQSGGVVPQARVTITSTDTNETRTATTGDDGAFRFPAVPEGHYSVRVEKEGFQTETQTGLTLEVAQELVVNSVLKVGSSTQQVTVTGEVPVIDTTNSTLGGTVNEQSMAELPLNGRNYADLTYFQPGVIQGRTAGYGGFQSDGATIRSNQTTLDGDILTEHTGAADASASGSTLGIDGIKEFNVVTGVFGAQYGGVSGAQIVMVSKGGTNQFHGDVFEYLRNSSMDAANYFDVPVAVNNYRRLPEFQRNNFGASGGGPIKKDKTFFYAAYEGLRLLTGDTILDTVLGTGCHGAAGAVITNTACPQLGNTASVKIAPVMAGNGVAGSTGLLGLYPLPNLPNNEFTDGYTSPTSENWGQIRVDQNISASDTLFGRYTVDEAIVISLAGSGNQGSVGTGIPAFLGATYSFDQFATISENHILSSTLLNTARLLFNRTDNPSYDATDFTGPAYSYVAGIPTGQTSINGIAGIGPPQTNPQGGNESGYAISDDVYWTKGRHALKFGAEVTKWDLGEYSSKALTGIVTFSSVAGFLTGVASSYETGELGALSESNHNWMYWVPGFYAQDDWRVSSRLTLNLGLRYEFMSQPHDTTNRSYALRNPLTDASFTQGPPLAPESKLHFSPRVGFAWDVQGNGKTSVRGGFGRYYDIDDFFEFFQGPDGSSPPISGYITHTGGTTPITLPLTFLPTDPIGAQIASYHFLNPSLDKWSLAVDRQLPWKMGLRVAYVGTRGQHDNQAEEGNPTIPQIVNGIPYWNPTEPRQNPNFGFFQYTTSTGWSIYNGLQVNLTKQLSHQLQFQAAYTWSHGLDNALSQSGSAECGGASGMTEPDYVGPGNTPYLKGPTCSDARNNVKFNLIYHLPKIESNHFAAKLEHGWWTGTIWTASSGFPFTPILGTNRSQSLNLKTEADYASIATAADAAACPAVSATCKYVPVPYNAKTVITHNPAQWYNPDMFKLTPMFSGPGSGVVCTAAPCYGTLGDAQRGLLRGPDLEEVDLSINKDTALPHLGEQGMLEFRAEMFNILNHPNFGMPNGDVFTGSTSDFGSYSEAPSGSAGQITATQTTSRQIQLALKIIF